MFDNNIKSRLMKLAGLDSNTPPQTNGRQLMSEHKVSKLLSKGYSYTDIALMEQNIGPQAAWMPAIDDATNPSTYANLITNRENAIGYLNAAMPTRAGLHDYMKNVEKFAAENPTIGSVNPSSMKGYLEYIGFDPAAVAALDDYKKDDRGAMETPMYKLMELMSKGADDNAISNFLSTDPEFTNHIKTVASSNATNDGNTEVANDLNNNSFTDIQNSASEIASFKEANPLLFDQDPDNDAFGTAPADEEEEGEEGGEEVDNTGGDAPETSTTNQDDQLDANVENNMTKELLSQKYPNAPEGYIDQVMNTFNQGGDTSAMTNWLDSNQNLYSNTDNPYNPDYQQQEEPELTTTIDMEGATGDISKDLNTLLKKNPAELRKWLHQDGNEQLLAQVNQQITAAGLEGKLDKKGTLTKYSDIAIDFLTNSTNVLNTANNLFNASTGPTAQNLTKGATLSDNSAEIDAIKTQNQSQADYNTAYQELQATNPFETGVDSLDTEKSKTIDVDDERNVIDPNAADRPNYYDAQIAGTFDPDQYTNPEKAYDYQQKTTTTMDNVLNRDAKSDRGYRGVSIYVDPNTLMPVKSDTEGALKIDPDDVHYKRDMNQQTTQSQAYMSANFPNIKPGTKKYEKLTKKYNKSIADVHKQHQKDLWNSDLKGQEVDYDSYNVSVTKHQKNQNKQKNKNKNQNTGDIKLKDLLGKTVSDTNVYYDSGGNALPAHLYGGGVHQSKKSGE